MSKIVKKARKSRDPNAPKIERKPINESVFVKAYMKVHHIGGGLMDVSRELGCSYAGARVKAEKLSEAGVNLPELKIGRTAKNFDVAALNAAIQEELDS